ncbi:MAG TPA: spermine synthase [Candidatus Binatia bacterium]|nr:spermine synthase [Candidatus Binatia bacterium]
MTSADDRIPPILSHYQAKTLLQARAEGLARITTSLTLGLTEVEVGIAKEGVEPPGIDLIAWNAVEEIAANDSVCFVVEQGQIHKIQFFSETLNRAYTLYPTTSAPTMLVSGVPMHRIKGTDPHQDTLAKIKTIAPLGGHVLDTAMGLGYTAIEAAKAAESVTTIELDPTVVEVCRLNPWSQNLFDNPKIARQIGDAFDVIEMLPDAAYQRVIHDPPMFSLAGHLYGEDFYRELYRVLSSRGRLFHYIGDLQSRSGAGVARGVRQRLVAAGFKRVVDRPHAFGLVTYK